VVSVSEAAVEEATDDDVDAATPEEPEGPDLDDDDFVDVPEDVAEQVAEADAEATDDTEDSNDADESAGESDGVPSQAADEDRTTIGDVYCNALGMGATVAKDRYGEGVDDRGDAMDEYADMARQLDLDAYVDDWVDAHGGPSELSPGQSIGVFSVVFAVMVLVEDADLAANVMDEVDPA
jgi:hypothetical protein